QVGVYRRPVDRHRAHVAVERLAVGAAQAHVGTDRGGLAGLAIVQRDAGTLAAEDHVRIPGIRSGNAVLLDVDRMPIVEGDLAVHRTARHAGGSGVLLATADEIGEAVVGGDVKHGGGGLRVPVAP